MTMRHVAVIGAGWAGCAAAIALADAGFRVTLFEAAPVPGGRARTVPRDGFALDNGQHLMLGAYKAARATIARVHAGVPPLRQRPLALSPLRDAPDALALRALALPAPWGLALGLARARGLTLRERMALLASMSGWRRDGFRCPRHATVAQLLEPLPPAASRELWAPLCVAALNTPPDRASAQVFLNVIAATFASDAQAADLVLPAGTLGEALPEAAVRWLRAAGHDVVLGTAATVAGIDRTGVEVDADTLARFDAAVVATGPHQLARALDDALAANASIAHALERVSGYAYESITTVYLGYRGPRMVVPDGLVRLDDDPGQWLFERDDILRMASAEAPLVDQLVAVVISASGAYDDLPQAELARRCDAQLRRARPELPPLAWSRVIAERRATYACMPGLAHPPARLMRGLYLAGDYVYPAFPATLEAAVRSGHAAAAAAVADLSR
jgi:squalene-associated FAD-dependent desaturase